MLRLHTVWLVPVALALVGFEPSAAPAIAQTPYTFSTTYDLSNGGRIITPEISEAYVSGESTDAPYGLTNLNGRVYVQTDLATGEFTANTDPTAFGLQGEPLGYFVLEGTGSDRLIGTETASGSLDLQTLRVTNNGTINITGGEGIFSGATGTLFFSEVGTTTTDPDVPYIGQVSVNGSFEAVPEPGTDIGMLVGMGIIGAGVLLRRRSRSSTSG